jgi:hypothetical protein
MLPHCGAYGGFWGLFGGSFFASVTAASAMHGMATLQEYALSLTLMRRREYHNPAMGGRVIQGEANAVLRDSNRYIRN